MAPIGNRLDRIAIGGVGAAKGRNTQRQRHAEEHRSFHHGGFLLPSTFRKADPLPIKGTNNIAKTATIIIYFLKWQ